MMLRKLFRRDAPEKIRTRLTLTRMRMRGAGPTNVTLKEAECFFRIAGAANKNLVQKLLPHIKDTGCVFDIGANAGFFSRELLSAHPTFRGTLVLFEPIAHLLSLATEVLSPFATVEKIFVNAALGSEAGTLDMYLPPNANIGWITAAKTTERQSTRVTARASRAASFVTMFKPEVIKIDVEGFEASVLQSILSALSFQYRPLFLVELEFEPNSPLRQLRDECIGKLRNLDYEVLSLDGSELTDDSLRAVQETIDVIIKPRQRSTENPNGGLAPSAVS